MALLPTNKSQPKQNLGEFRILAYGAPKVGKTTWASKFPAAIFLCTEAGHNAVEVYKVDVPSWEVLLEACREITEAKHGFETLVVDTLDNMWQLCRDYICRRYKVEFEGDLQYGKGYALVLNEFTRVINKLSMLPFGLVMISHADVEEIETRTGVRRKIVPSLKDKPRKLVLGLTDMILYIDMETGTSPDGKSFTRRVIRTQPSPYFEAGDRTGRLPEVIDLDYAKFVEAFNRGGQDKPAKASVSTPVKK